MLHSGYFAGLVQQTPNSAVGSEIYRKKHPTRNYKKPKMSKPQPSTSPRASTGTEKSLDQFRQEVLVAHNKRRERHSAPPVQISKELNLIAQKWADTLAKKGKLEHSPPESRKNAGENVAANSRNLNGDEVTEMWYTEIKDYDFKKSVFSLNTGHFTQVVWKECKSIGVGMSPKPSSGGMNFYVCNYFPVGNIQGQFEANVLPPKQRA